MYKSILKVSDIETLEEGQLYLVLPDLKTTPETLLENYEQIRKLEEKVQENIKSPKKTK